MAQTATANTTFLNYNNGLKKIANDFTRIVCSNFRNSNPISIEEQLNIPGRDAPVTLGLHRKISILPEITGCYNLTSRTEQDFKFTLSEGDNCVQNTALNYLNFENILGSLNFHLDKLINGETLQSESRKQNVQNIVNAAFVEDPSELKALSETININTNLYLASRHGTNYSNAVSLILEKLFDSSYCHPSIKIPIDDKKKLEMAVIRLLNNGAIPELQRHKPLETAIRRNCVGLVRALIDNNLATEAVKHECIVGYMIDSPVDGNLLDLANIYGRTEIAQILRDELGMKPHLEDYSALTSSPR